MSALDDLVSQLQNAVRNIGRATIAIENMLPRVTGTFTLSNATTTVITQPAISGNAVVSIMPINASAALIQRTAGLYHSATVAGTSFSISTQSGSAAGTEQFSYTLINVV